MRVLHRGWWRAFGRDCLGFVVGRLLLGRYLCFSGLFLYEQGWGQRNTQGHKQGAGRLQPFKTDNVSQLSDFIKWGLTINPLNTRALLFYFIIFLFPKATFRSCWRSHTVQYLSLWHSYVIPSCALWLRWHTYVTTGLYKVSCIQCCQWNPAEVRVCARARTCTSVGLFSTLNHPSVHMTDSCRDSGFKNVGHLRGQWSISGSLGGMEHR